MVNSPAVKSEDIAREEDEETLEGTEKTWLRSLAATLSYTSRKKK